MSLQSANASVRVLIGRLRRDRSGQGSSSRVSEPRYILTRDGLYVLDSFYCYRQVYRPPCVGYNSNGGPLFSYPLAQALARHECARLNAEELAA